MFPSSRGNPPFDFYQDWFAGRNFSYLRGGRAGRGNKKRIARGNLLTRESNSQLHIHCGGLRARISRNGRISRVIRDRWSYVYPDFRDRALNTGLCRVSAAQDVGPGSGGQRRRRRGRGRRGARGGDGGPEGDERARRLLS